MIEYHMVFCCGENCLEYEIRHFLKSKPGVRTDKYTITTNDGKFRFIINPSDNTNLLRGKRIDSWRRCPHTKISDELTLILREITKDRFKGSYRKLEKN